MMKLTTHLKFNGRCREAFEFYERCLGGKITSMMTYGDSPMAEKPAPQWREKVLHATLVTGEGRLYGIDVGPEEKYQPPAGFEVTIGLSDGAEADRIFARLSEGGKVKMPLQKTFWASAFGVVVDRFGISWEVNCGAPS
jgi:PhnB protein